MQQLQRTSRAQTRLPSTALRRLTAPVLAIAALALSTTSAIAFASVAQAKPQLNVETERTAQGARLTFKAKGWGPAARVKISGTRAPGANGVQDFGVYSADSSGSFSMRKIVACTTSNMEDGANESVTVTAADSATGVKVSQKVQGGAWVCQ